MLKLTKLFFALSLLFFASSCANDDESTDTAGLLGTWTAVTFSADITTSASVGGTDVTSTINAVGANFSYDLTFTESAFTTSGDYDVTTSGATAGIIIPASTSSYTDVSGNGTYTSTDTELTINGSFFTFDFNGVPQGSTGEAQTVTYEINSNNELIITQNETQETTSSGVTSTSTIVSSSTWTKQ